VLYGTLVQVKYDSAVWHTSAS